MFTSVMIQCFEKNVVIKVSTKSITQIGNGLFSIKDSSITLCFHPMFWNLLLLEFDF